MTDDDRLDRIETKLAFAEDLLQSLNETVLAQHERILRLEERCQALVERMTALGVPGAETDPDERPPHY